MSEWTTATFTSRGSLWRWRDKPRASKFAPGNVESRQAYRQRWKVETIMSMVKRKWGEALTARIDASQAVQALLRGLVYNAHRLVALLSLQ